MNIAVLGATGTTGHAAVEYTLSQGHQVTAYVRRPDAIPPRDKLTITQGSVEDDDAMVSSFTGHDAVVSCLGARVEAKNLLKGTDFQRRTLPKVIAAINQAGVPRFVLLSSLGIGDTAGKQSLIPRLLSRTIARKLFDDKVQAEQSLPNCAANWTAVYPVSLKTGTPDNDWELVPVNTVDKVPGVPMLTFATVAHVLIDLAADPSHPREKLILTRRGAWRSRAT